MNSERSRETDKILFELIRHLSEINALMKMNISIDRERSLNVMKKRLERSGINPKSKGYGYIEMAVMISIDHGKDKINFKRKVYPAIAAKHSDVTPDSVEHAIRNAIKSAYKRNRQLNHKGKCAVGLREGCLSNKRFIMDIVSEIRQCIHTEVLNF